MEVPTEHMTFFPFHSYGWFYCGFTGLVRVFLLVDLGLFHRKAHKVGFREATVWTVVWACLAVVFCLGLYRYIDSLHGAVIAKKLALEFMTGYVVEWSLSLDNMFVFVLVFRYFAIPPELQHRVLFYGILGALIFRAIFIALGAALLRFEWVIFLFGGFLVFTGVKLVFSSETEIDPEGNILVRALRKLLPVTQTLEGQRFVVRRQRKLFATPLLVTLVFVEATDILFAVDSVPAIFAITTEPLIVFTSNVFAILGLRAMYFLLAGAVELFHLLRYGLALILIFVGIKMTFLNRVWGGHFPTGISLAFIVGVLAVTILLSLAFPKKPAAP